VSSPICPDLRQVTEADVYIGDDLAAGLARRDGDDVSFDYVGGSDSIVDRVRCQRLARQM
jgi:hypothetical protein